MRKPEMRDVVVVVPGIQGSQLAKYGRPVWALSGRALWDGLRTLGGSIKDLQLPDDVGDEHPNDGVEAIGLMPDLHGIPGLGPFIRGYTGLMRWLRQDFGLHLATPTVPGNLVEFPYDWRLSNRLNARLLKDRAEAELKRWREAGGSDAKLVFVCHSMGGLVARYYLEVLGGAEWTRALVTMGTPHRGSANSVVNLVNGVRIGKGPFRLEVSALARSFPSVYQLLPTYRCVNTNEGRQDLQTSALPRIDAAKVADAAALHREIERGNGAGSNAYIFRMVVGTRQPTKATVTPVGNRVEALDTIDGNDERGDGTVPRFASIPDGVAPTDARQLNSAQTHGWLHLHRSILDDLHGILTAREIVYMEEPADLGRQVGIEVPELQPTGVPLNVRATSDDPNLLLRVDLERLGGGVEEAVLTNEGGGSYTGLLLPTGPGVHRVTVHGPRMSGIEPISAAVLVDDVEEET